MSNGKKRIVMYVYNDITTDARVQRAANALSAVFDVTVLSLDKGKTVDDTNIKNVLLKGKSKKPVLNYFSTIWQAYRFIKKKNPEVFYGHDYYSALLIKMLQGSGYHGKLIYDAHELIIPDEGRKSMRTSFFYWFEKFITKRVSLLICASEQRGNIMKEHYGLSSLPLVIPNISLLKLNDNDSNTQFLLKKLQWFFELPLPTVVYAGVVTGSRHIIELFDATLALADKCKLLIVGDGDVLDSIREKASEHPELYSAFTGSIPYKCLGSILSRCDIGFLYYPLDTLNNRYCASNKIYEYASVGLPMLANDNPTLQEELIKYHIGIATSSLKQGLEQLLDSPKEYKDNCQLFIEGNCWGKLESQLVNAVINL